MEAKKLADKKDKEEGYAPLYWLVINTGILPAGSKWRGNKESVFEFWRINTEILEIKKSSNLNTVKALVPEVTKWIRLTTGKVESDLVIPEAAYATSYAKMIATSKWLEDTLKLCITKLLWKGTTDLVPMPPPPSLKTEQGLSNGYGDSPRRPSGSMDLT